MRHFATYYEAVDCARMIEARDMEDNMEQRKRKRVNVRVESTPGNIMRNPRRWVQNQTVSSRLVASPMGNNPRTTSDTQ